MRVGVLGEGAERTARHFSRFFARFYNETADETANNETADQTAESISGDIACNMPLNYDILLLLSDDALSGRCLSSLKDGAVVLADTDNVPLSSLLGYEGLIVTFGFNSRACITASSIMDDDSIQVCVQRSLLTCKGEVMFEQEFPVTLPVGDPKTVLALCACAILCGLYCGGEKSGEHCRAPV